MSVMTYICDGTNVRTLSPSNDTVTPISLDLWDLTEEVRVCADVSGDAEDYQRSIFRFSEEQRMLFAGLAFLDLVHRSGLPAYFASALSFGFADAVSCFRACGSHAIAAAMTEALQYRGAVSNGTEGAVAFESNSGDDLIQIIAGEDVIEQLRAFVRINAASFERW